MDFISNNIEKWIGAGIGSIVTGSAPFIIRKWRRSIKEKAEKQKAELKSILFEFQQTITQKQDDIFSAIKETREKLTEQYNKLNEAREADEKQMIELASTLDARILLCEDRHKPWDGITDRRKK